METKIKKNGVKFLMETDWVFKGGLDYEHKKYILLSYFQKLNKNLEEYKIYPMFTELSLHLGNMQTLITKNQILYVDKKIESIDEEILLIDLKVKDIPSMTDKEFEEYQKILKYSQPKIFDYFNIAKSLWMVINEKINITIRKNKNNLQSKEGFFYFVKSNEIYMWKYTIKKAYKVENQYRTKIELIYKGDKQNFTVTNIISEYSKSIKIKNDNKFPVFEVTCDEEFPLDETLLPIFKRKIMTMIAQTKKLKKVDNYENNGYISG
jgi:hypothetical protein